MVGSSIRVCVLGVASTALGCAGPQPTDPSPRTEAGVVEASANRGGAGNGRSELPGSGSRSKVAIDLPDPIAGDLGPEVLLPRKKPDDAEVVSIEGFSIRKSHIFDRLFEYDSQGMLAEADRLVFDVLLAKQAEKHKIFVDEKSVDKIVKDSEDTLVATVKKDWPGISLDEFLLTTKGVNLQVHRRILKRRVSRGLLRYYVIRYLAGLEDRVQVRVISHRNRATTERILAKLKEGADFSSLARRDSDHPSRSAGGLVPPFGKASGFVFKDRAFELKEGELSEVLTTTKDGVNNYYLLYCVKRIPGRQESFKKMKAELDRDRLQNPLKEDEGRDLYGRLRSASETLHNAGGKR